MNPLEYDDPLLMDLDSMIPPMPEGKEHLVYRDFPKMPVNVWEWVKSVLADYELHLLTEAKYQRGPDTVMRGQIWVHPDGLKALNQRFKIEGAALFNPTQ